MTLAPIKASPVSASVTFPDITPLFAEMVDIINRVRKVILVNMLAP
jgi:hypothetical protein